MARKAPQLAKLTRPRLYRAVLRERLFELLDEKREHPVVWIVGPPGAGKTTLAASYLEEAGVPAIWYQIDSGDGDPATFFYYLKQAVDPVSQGKPKSLPLLTTEYLSDVPAFARRFLRDAFARLPDDVVFVFDNYHELTDGSSLHAVFKAALMEVPPGANILVVSRVDPPTAFVELLVNQRIAVITWNDLRLTPEETTAIAASRGVEQSPVLSALHAQSGGWMAGVTLMLERLRGGEELETMYRTEALDTVFEYFAGLIFDNASEEIQDVLMKTAFLPWVNNTLAQIVTGVPQAIRHLEELHRRHIFTDRRAGEETTFQYHALFRTFLRSRANASLLPLTLRSLMGRAAAELLAREHSEEAFALFVEAAEWHGAEQVVIDSASSLIAQGRWRTLKQWVEALPEAHVRSNPWMGYWSGRSMIFVDPASARPVLEIAYQAFVDKGDAIGQLLSATTILEGIYFEFENLKPMDPWIERVVAFLQRGVRAPTREDDLRANSAVMMGATFRVPVHSMLESCLRRVFDLLKEPFEPNLKVAAASMLHGYSNVAMDAQAERMASSIARPLLNSKDLSPQRALFYWKTEGYSHYLRGRYVQAFECFNAAEAIAREHSLQDVNAISVSSNRGLCERRAGLLDEAEDSLRRLEVLPIPQTGYNHGKFTLLRAVVAFDRGNIQHAIDTILKAYKAYDDAGFFNGIVTVGTVASNMAVAGGRFDLADKILGRLRSENYGTIAENYLAAIILNQAWLSHRRGNFESRDMLLGDALRRARLDGARIRFHWYANAMAELIPIALSSGIEADMARAIAREFSVVPYPPDIEDWPWLLKVYTLGRFELLIDGEHPEYSRKAPKKVLALLKAIIAFGGSEVSEQKLIDALWPDDDGDAARRSLTATLHRLRKLLVKADAIRQTAGKLTLDQRCCWVDATAFESRVDREAGAGAGESAISIYRGAFLAQEEDAPWAVPRCERLRAKFIHAVGRKGVSLEASGRYDSAIDLYIRGIEADNLIEPFYQGLMRCYGRLDRSSEAASAYRRLRQTLSVTLGVAPSSATQRLFETLRLS